MPVLELNNISKSYDQKSLVVQNISFSLERDDFLVLLGPSGCGKSTILNMIAGLESVTSGDIFLNGVRINDLSSQNRNIAMVFQNYALYPNMTVWDNIAFPLKNRHMKKLEIINAINKIAETLSIKPLLKKYPSQLSGGEKQRVAIGRALVRKPSLFLLDEPLSNLDTALRNQLRYELFQLKSKVDVPMVYVTHDQVEALTLATKIIILSNGVIQQIGSPHEIFNSPQNLFVAKFICSPMLNIIENLPVICENGHRCCKFMKTTIVVNDTSIANIMFFYKCSNKGKHHLFGFLNKEFCA